jgi:hypothetical protein
MLRKILFTTVIAGLGWTGLGAESVGSGNEMYTFSMPESTLLFGTANELVRNTIGHAESIRAPFEVSANSGFFTYPSISSSGDLIAWGFFTKIEKAAKGTQTRSALGVYSLANQTWKTFGDPEDTGSIDVTSISPDNLHVAFVHEEEYTKNFERDLRILDLDDGVIRSIPHPSIWYRTTLSWSPDSKKIVMIIDQVSKSDPAVAIVDLQSGNVTTLGEGLGAAWSPSGEWIAYLDTTGEKCVLVHPDGTGKKVVAHLHQSVSSSEHFGWGGPVWSPDSKHLLVTEMMGDLRTFGIAELDMESGRIRTIKRPALPIFGWARNEM